MPDQEAQSPDSSTIYRACWLFVRRLAAQYQSEDFDILATEMEPLDYGGSFDPAVKLRWQEIWDSEIADLPIRIVARFIEAEGAWGRGDSAITDTAAASLRAREPSLLGMLEASIAEVK